MKEVDVLIVHDKADMGFIIAQTLADGDIIELVDKTAFVTSIHQALDLLNTGLRPKTVITHKGIENGSTVAELVNGMRKTEGGDLIRLGIVSGEFFGEHVCATALELGADFGWDMTERMFHPVPQWVVDITNLGYLHPKELELRGHEIVLSAETARKRLELFSATSAP
jgi:hypothetical protein